MCDDCRSEKMKKVARKNLTKWINSQPIHKVYYMDRNGLNEYPDNTVDEFARGIK